MNEAVKVLLAIALLLIPVYLCMAPFRWYGKRHGWDIKQYRWVGVGTIVTWSIVYGVGLLHFPLSLMLGIDVAVLIPMSLLIIVLNRAGM